MGSDLHLLVAGNVRHLDAITYRALAMIDDLEARWSRFVPTSEICRLNAAAGAPVAVSPDTVLLVERAVEAWSRTDGLFDPTMLLALVAAGYDRDFDQLGSAPSAVDEPLLVDDQLVLLGPELEPRCGEIVIDGDGGTVRLPPGVGFDPGGLGKGLAADLVADALLDWGADGALVNIGGDLRCAGRPLDGEGWVVTVPGSGDHDRMIELAGGGVATSTCLRRRWLTEGGPAHHLLDPATGRPASRAARSVTVLAATCCDAETLATALAANGGLPQDRSMIGNAVVLLVDHESHFESYGPIDRFLR